MDNTLKHLVRKSYLHYSRATEQQARSGATRELVRVITPDDAVKSVSALLSPKQTSAPARLPGAAHLLQGNGGCGGFAAALMAVASHDSAFLEAFAKTTFSLSDNASGNGFHRCGKLKDQNIDLLSRLAWRYKLNGCGKYSGTPRPDSILCTALMIFFRNHLRSLACKNRQDADCWTETLRFTYLHQQAASLNKVSDEQLQSILEDGLSSSTEQATEQMLLLNPATRQTLRRGDIALPPSAMSRLLTYAFSQAAGASAPVEISPAYPLRDHIQSVYNGESGDLAIGLSRDGTSAHRAAHKACWDAVKTRRGAAQGNAQILGVVVGFADGYQMFRQFLHGEEHLQAFDPFHWLDHWGFVPAGIGTQPPTVWMSGSVWNAPSTFEDYDGVLPRMMLPATILTISQARS